MCTEQQHCLIYRCKYRYMALVRVLITITSCSACWLMNASLHHTTGTWFRYQVGVPGSKTQHQIYRVPYSTNYLPIVRDESCGCVHSLRNDSIQQGSGKKDGVGLILRMPSFWLWRQLLWQLEGMHG